MSKTKATRKWRAAFFWTALMLMLAGPAEISYAQGTAVTAKPAVPGVIAPAKPAVPGAIAPAKPAVQGPAVPAKLVTQATPAPQAAQEQAQAYRYNPDVRIDPFKPFVDLNAAAKKKMEKSKPLSPLQQAGIEAFTLVGIIEGNKRRRAMVQDASGKFYSLVPGTYIGMNRGRVTAIHKDSVIVLERIKTDGGKIESRRQVMKLRQDEVKP